MLLAKIDSQGISQYVLEAKCKKSTGSKLDKGPHGVPKYLQFKFDFVFYIKMGNILNIAHFNVIYFLMNYYRV